MQFSTKLITRTALFLALAVLLPIGFHQFGMAGRIFLPMHIPVLLAGFIAGPVSGAAVGVLAPGLSFMVTGMPPAYAVFLMSIELLAYGLTAGLLYGRWRLNIYLALVLSLLFGRTGFSLALLLMGQFVDLPYGVKEYFAAAVVTGLPGMAIQLVIIPPIVISVRRWMNP